MKVLIRAGETNKVIKSAKIFKKREASILAANYIQTLEIRDNQLLFSTVVDLYTKAQGFDKLARFYESAGQIKIDEYQDYPRGIELIIKSLEILKRDDVIIKNKEAAIKVISSKIHLINMFIEASENYKDSPKQAIATCVDLLRTNDIDLSVRSDDIYILMARDYSAQGNNKNAFKFLEDLRQSDTEIINFLELSEIDRIYQSAGVKDPTQELNISNMKQLNQYFMHKLCPNSTNTHVFEITQTLAFDRIELIGWSFDPKQRLG